MTAFNGYASWEDGHSQALADYHAGVYERDFNDPPCSYSFIDGYIKTMNSWLESFGPNDAEYSCCPRKVGTGHKMGCSIGGRQQTIISARLNDDGTLEAL